MSLYDTAIEMQKDYDKWLKEHHNKTINPHTVGELIDELNKLDPKTRVEFECACIDIVKDPNSGEQVLMVEEG